jgi:hypothetical protein
MLYSTSQAADIDAVREVTEEKLAEDPSFDANAYFKTQVQTLLGLDDVTNPDSTVYDPDGTRATRIRTITAGLDFAAGDATKLARALTDYVPAMSAPLAAKVQELEASNLAADASREQESLLAELEASTAGIEQLQAQEEAEESVLAELEASTAGIERLQEQDDAEAVVASISAPQPEPLTADEQQSPHTPTLTPGLSPVRPFPDLGSDSSGHSHSGYAISADPRDNLGSSQTMGDVSDLRQSIDGLTAEVKDLRGMRRFTLAGEPVRDRQTGEIVDINKEAERELQRDPLVQRMLAAGVITVSDIVKGKQIPLLNDPVTRRTVIERLDALEREAAGKQEQLTKQYNAEQTMAFTRTIPNTQFKMYVPPRYAKASMPGAKMQQPVTAGAMIGYPTGAYHT